MGCLDEYIRTTFQELLLLALRLLCEVLVFGYHSQSSDEFTCYNWSVSGTRVTRQM